MSRHPPTLPILPAFRPGGILIRRPGERVTHQRFLGQVAALARALPDAPYTLNLCEDRHRFLVTLGACLVRGSQCLLPADRLASTVAEIAAGHPGALCVADTPVPGLSLPLWTLGELAAEDAHPGALPEIPCERD